jgi:hypothetical protein
MAHDDTGVALSPVMRRKNCFYPNNTIIDAMPENIFNPQ